MPIRREWSEVSQIIKNSSSMGAQHQKLLYISAHHEKRIDIWMHVIRNTSQMPSLDGPFPGSAARAHGQRGRARPIATATVGRSSRPSRRRRTRRRLGALRAAALSRGHGERSRLQLLLKLAFAGNMLILVVDDLA